MLNSTARREVISHTRATPLANLAGLCLVLHEHGEPLHVSALAQKAIERAILDEAVIAQGNRLPTRINHHMIALRKLELVTSVLWGGHTWYSLTQTGKILARDTRQTYSDSGAPNLDDRLREIWRPVLVQSAYVRHQWLKYFMPRENFTCSELASAGNTITISRVPQTQRFGEDDSGYRILSDYWGERALDEVERREIYEGLRRWTNDAYLTDDRLPKATRGPFLHHGSPPSSTFESESHIVKAWLSPEKDLSLFETHIEEVLDKREQGNRITIPELIITMCDEYNYAKQNVKDMLVTLYYDGDDHYFFERASKFLIRQAFKGVKPEDYYVQIEGVWRTGLVCY